MRRSDHRFTVVTVPSPEFIRVDRVEPHAARGRQLLAAHPELRALAGPQPATALWVGLLVAIQCGLALWLGPRRWFVWLPLAYIVGATIDHALWALIHDCCHNLVFRSRTANRWVAIAANFPLVVPGAISFCKYHLLHHRHMGDMDLDAGVPGTTESAVIGRSRVAKTVWLAGYIFVQGIVRPRRLSVRLLDGWTMVNIVVQFAFLAAVVTGGGRGAVQIPGRRRRCSRSGCTRSARAGSRSTSRSCRARRPIRTTGRSTRCRSTSAITTSITTWSRCRGRGFLTSAASRRSSTTGSVVLYVVDVAARAIPPDRNITLFNYIIRRGSGRDPESAAIAPLEAAHGSSAR